MAYLLMRIRDYIPRRRNGGQRSENSSLHSPFRNVTPRNKGDVRALLAFPPCTTKRARSTGATCPFKLLSSKTEREQCEHVILRMSRRLAVI